MDTYSVIGIIISLGLLLAIAAYIYLISKSKVVELLSVLIVIPSASYILTMLPLVSLWALKDSLSSRYILLILFHLTLIGIIIKMLRRRRAPTKRPWSLTLELSKTKITLFIFFLFLALLYLFAGPNEILSYLHYEIVSTAHTKGPLSTLTSATALCLYSLTLVRYLFIHYNLKIVIILCVIQALLFYPMAQELIEKSELLHRTETAEETWWPYSGVDNNITVQIKTSTFGDGFFFNGIPHEGVRECTLKSQQKHRQITFDKTSDECKDQIFDMMSAFRFIREYQFEDNCIAIGREVKPLRLRVLFDKERGYPTKIEEYIYQRDFHMNLMYKPHCLNKKISIESYEITWEKATKE